MELQDDSYALLIVVYLEWRCKGKWFERILKFFVEEWSVGMIGRKKTSNPLLVTCHYILNIFELT